MQQLIAMRRQLNQHLSMIFTTGKPPHRPTFDQAVDQFHRAVMPQAKPVRKRGNGRASPRRQTFESEKKLMLLWLNAYRPGSFFTEM
jgi:hypothetical protein